MNTLIRYRSKLVILGAALLAAVAGGRASADDSEIFTGNPNILFTARPNILFIFDTSGSMDSEISPRPPYDPSVDYSGDCQSDRVYYRTGSNISNPPDCDGSTQASWVPASYFRCDAATGPLATLGYYADPDDRAARWRASRRRWQSLLSESESYVECRADAGIHGDGTSTTRLWARDGGSNPWTSNSANEISWDLNGITNYTFFSHNWLNWYHYGGVTTRTRLEIVKEAATAMVNQLEIADSVNVGLMRYSSNTTNQCAESSAEGGMVVRAMDTIANNADGLRSDIAAFNASGCTPLSETMFEAFRYMSGGQVRFGLDSRTTPAAGGEFPSVAASRQDAPNENIYDSPLTDSCERNFIVLLTDGLPTAARSADADIEALIGGSCVGTGNGRCLEEIARHMYENDLRPTVPERQNVTTYTIGFGPDVASGTTLLQNTAAGGGGQYFAAGDAAELALALTDIVRDILRINTSFTAPAVSVNAFNRTQNLNDLYVTVFKPSETYVWPGNIKKYQLGADGTIRDVNGNPAVDINTGFFRSSAQSYWTTGVDGADIELGGAANEHPLAADRKVYSNLGSDPVLSAEENWVVIANAAIDEALLGLASGDPPGRDALIDWLRGADVDDEDGDGDLTEQRFEMNDPMHGRPATVIYGGTEEDPDVDDGIIYAVTNGGYLHAIDVNDGSELWSFVPRDLLARAGNLYRDPAVTERSYGLDGNVRLYKHDVDGNGIVESDEGDRVWLFFGMRRGGQDYYGLDVTDRDNPRLMWKIGPDESGAKELPGAGQSWSTPAVARVNIEGASQNALKLVLIFGGGYDTVQDNGPYTVDSVGNRIFMVDALSGNRLWYAGPNDEADLQLTSMTHSIPADVRVADLSGDGLADRMYAADMGGRVWRFDIWNGSERDELVTGGVFASLGNAHETSHSPATTRRFYNAPDVAFLSCSAGTVLNIALGSGYRAHPLDLGTQDRFYSLRDTTPFARLTQDQYDDLEPITEEVTGTPTDLVDVTTELTPTIPPGSKGWRMDLRPAGSWRGEKSLAEARTFQNIIQFPTYEPNPDPSVSSTACTPSIGLNRLYSVNACNAAPITNRDSPSDPPDSVDDRTVQLDQGGIAPEVVWLFPSPENPESCVGAECRPPPVCLVGLESCVGAEGRPEPVCLVGREACGVGAALNPVRTFWGEEGVN